MLLNTIDKRALSKCSKWNQCSSLDGEVTTDSPSNLDLSSGRLVLRSSGQPFHRSHLLAASYRRAVSSSFSFDPRVALLPKPSDRPYYDESADAIPGMDLSWMMDLRFRGYRFRILSHAWVYTIHSYLYRLDERVT